MSTRLRLDTLKLSTAGPPQKLRSLPADVGYVAILGAGLALAGLFQYVTAQAYERALRNYRDVALNKAAMAGKSIKSSLDHIYQNIRTISMLPSVSNIERHGENIDGDARMSIQQIYNNLANNVAVSEVYIVPADLDPEAIDSKTGKPHEPILKFDALITGRQDRVQNPAAGGAEEASGHEEVEIYEYREFHRQLAWLKEKYPTSDNFEGLHVPFVSSREVITCDNSSFNSTGMDPDRMGILMSVPFYGPDRKLKGTVSAIIRSKALAALLPAQDYALLDQEGGFAIGALKGGQQVTSHEWVMQGNPDPTLLFSAALPLAVDRATGRWLLWAGHPDAAFLSSNEATSINTYRTIGFGVCGCLTLMGLAMWRETRKRRAAELAHLNSELADNYRKLEAANAHVTDLNVELLGTMTELKQAQDDIVKKGKMAQLGQLTATVAHEIRNPLGAIKTSAQLISRKVQDKNLGIEKSLERINNSITRCDNIITELLDFARSKTLTLKTTSIDDLVRATVDEEVKNMPEGITVTFAPCIGGMQSAFDADRMRRVLVNLLSNAAEAMVGKVNVKLSVVTENPRIHVATKLVDGNIEISVADNGPGITQENIAKILEPLFTTKSFGVGLGLPAVEKILEHHGGGLRIESTPGEGATFTAWFPMQQIKAQAA